LSVANYGYDRPDFAKYLPLGAGLIIGLAVLSWSSVLTGWAAIAASVVGNTLGLILIGFGLVFLLSKRGKLKQRDVLLNAIPWRGDERVLDVGCGPGLLLVGAAKKLTTGAAIGVDIWDKSVESSNSPATATRNAEIEGVGNRVEVKDGDARRLGFKEASFDVVMARAVLHHIKVEAERSGAIHEMLRVLKPGGHLGLILIDFGRLGRYTQTMRENGVDDVRVLKPRISPWTTRAFGTVILVARKAGHL
jgi:ubiquinone/menaquinone biosynthesis C-methylase UbiE